MPKYTQTLTANTYNATDFSTSLKTAFDSLGWGTGKVDISGGYRFTATDQSNSETNPLTINTFNENYMGKNIVLPSNDSFYGTNGLYCLGMYLPGVSSFRLKYTLMSASMPNGTNITTPANTRQMYMYTYLTSRPDFQAELNLSTVVREIKDFPTTMTVGTQYTTPWSTFNISSHPSIFIKHSIANTYLRLDSIEYKVAQDKFAFQSPNLDSPTFESTSINFSGTLISTLTSYPIKDAKIPIVRLVRTNGLVTDSLYAATSNYNTSSVSGNLVSFWNQAVLNSHDDLSKVGVNFSIANKDRVAEGSFGSDIIIRAGSNSNFQGFFINTQQGAVYNGAVWDTIDKTRSYPNSTPSFPAQRRSASMSVDNPKLTTEPTSSSAGTYVRQANHTVYQVVKVKNQASLMGFSVSDSWSYSNMEIVDHPITYTLYSAELLAEGGFKLNNQIIPPTKTTLTVRNAYTNKNTVSFANTTTLNPGLYVLAILSERIKAYANQSITTLDDTPSVYKTRDIEVIHSNNFCRKKTASVQYQGVRYIRSSMSGSNRDGSSHWVEIQALNSSNTNYALNKPVTTPNLLESGSQAISVVTDNSTSSSNYVSIAPNSDGRASITVDLGTVYTDISLIKVWKYYADTRVYRNHSLEVSTDNINWVRIDEGGDTAEVSTGRTYKLPTLNSFVDNYEEFSFSSVYNGADSVVGGPLTTIAMLPPSTMLQVQLEQISSPTPSHQTTSFAENWVSSAGRSATFSSSAFRKEALTKGAGNRFIMEGRFPFGVDLQSGYAVSLSPWGVMTVAPGALSEQTGSSLQTNTSSRPIEFINTTNKFDNGTRYHRVWYANRRGMSLRSRNIFISPLPNISIGVSYVTPDGNEFVVVTTHTSVACLFRLTS